LSLSVAVRADTDFAHAAGQAHADKDWLAAGPTKPRKTDRTGRWSVNTNSWFRQLWYDVGYQQEAAP